MANRQIVSTEVGAVSMLPYSQTVPDLLFHIKRSFAGGVNRMVIHGSPYSGDYVNTTWPGYNAFFYRFTEMWNSLQPCWQHLKDTLDFVGRNSYVLQQGVAKVDLAFYLYADPFEIVPRYNSTNLQALGMASSCCTICVLTRRRLHVRLHWSGKSAAASSIRSGSSTGVGWPRIQSTYL